MPVDRRSARKSRTESRSPDVLWSEFLTAVIEHGHFLGDERRRQRNVRRDRHITGFGGRFDEAVRHIGPPSTRSALTNL
jgi:hypothetical protein